MFSFYTEGVSFRFYKNSCLKKLGFLFTATENGQIQHDTVLDYEHSEAMDYLNNSVSHKLAYKLITDVNVNKHSADQNISFELPFDGYYESQGEYAYNQKLRRYEHDVIDSDGSKYLAIWN